MTSTKRPTSVYSRSSLASYLMDLGYETMILPGGMPQPPQQASQKQSPHLEEADGRAGASDRSRGAEVSAVSRRSEEATTEVRQAPARFNIEPGLSQEERATKLAEVQESSLGCTACVLSNKRNKVVFGSGSASADLMLIGEGPGAQEDRQGLPFVGPAGELLTKMLKAIDFDRSDVYIANMVKCRPPGNRDPRPDEVIACSGFLEAQVQLIQPKVILALGRVAAQALLRTDTALGRLRTRWHVFHGVPVWVTYHPAALLRNASYKRPTWEDLQHVRDHLAKPEL